MLEFSGVMKGKCGLLTSVLPSLAAFLSFVIAAVQIAGVARESFRAVSRANEEHGRVCSISITVAIAGCGAHSYYGPEQRR